jgi:hypothetical protein
MDTFIGLTSSLHLARQSWWTLLSIVTRLSRPQRKEGWHERLVDADVERQEEAEYHAVNLDTN